MSAASQPQRHPFAWVLLGCLGSLLCLVLVFELADIRYCQLDHIRDQTLKAAKTRQMFQPFSNRSASTQQQDVQQAQQGQQPQTPSRSGSLQGQALSEGAAPQQSSSTSSTDGRPFKFAYATFVASNNSRYIKWASLQGMAARRHMPEATHITYVASTVQPAVAAALRGVGATVELIDPFPEQHQHGPTWINQLTKVKLWTKSEYDMMCYMDSDVIFFANITKPLVEECRPKLLSGAVDICGYENEMCESDPLNVVNRGIWGMPYMEASMFCMRPNMTLYQALLQAGVEELQHEDYIVMRGKNVYTEQDFLNLYFKGRIHYFPCSVKTGGRANGTIVHTKYMEDTWAHRTGSLPLELFFER